MSTAHSDCAAILKDVKTKAEELLKSAPAREGELTASDLCVRYVHARPTSRSHPASPPGPGTLAEAFQISKRLREEEYERAKESLECVKDGQSKSLPQPLKDIIAWNKLRPRRAHQEDTGAGTSKSSHLIAQDDLVLTLLVYDSMRSNTSQMKLVLCLRVLGSQLLAVLPEQLRCPTQGLHQQFSQQCCAPYLFIEDTFYEDRRDSAALRTSTDIIEFLREKCTQPPNSQGPYVTSLLVKDVNQLAVGDMHHTRFMDLVLTDEDPPPYYVYCHEGCCEHLFQIVDVHLVHPTDAQLASAYPEVVVEVPHKRPLCSVCCKNTAVKLVADDPLAPRNPCFYCDTCHDMLHSGGERGSASMRELRYSTKY